MGQRTLLFHEIFLRQLVEKEIQISVAYDIGAYKGQYARMVNRVFPKTKLFLFEANNEHTNELDKLGFPSFIATLLSSERDVEFFAEGTSGDSVFRENSSFYANTISRVHKSTSLLKLSRIHNLPSPDLIKIDVQGAELEVIKGGLSLVKSAKILIVEMSLLEYNHNAPRITEVLDYLKKIGFSPIKVLESHSREGELFQIDIAFAAKELVSKFL